MERTVSATEAKTHFGRLIKRAGEDGETLIVERSGVPQIAIVPIGEFERMKGARRQKGHKITLCRIRSLKRTFHERLAKEGSGLPDLDVLLDNQRNERDGEIIDSLR